MLLLHIPILFIMRNLIVYLFMMIIVIKRNQYLKMYLMKLNIWNKKYKYFCIKL